MKKEWLKNISRDLLSLGSIVFYILVVGRAMIYPYYLFLTELLVAAILLFAIYLYIKEFDTYTARALILTVLTSHFYESFTFSLFAASAFILIVVSSVYIGNDKKEITKGIIFAVISLIPALGISFYLSAKYGISNY